MKKLTLAPALALVVAFGLAGCAAGGLAPAPGVVAPPAAAAPTATTPVAPGTFDHSGFSALLGKYVKDGRFDYGALKANAEDTKSFNAYITLMGDADISSLTKPEQHAFWINAYNAFNIKAVEDKWPIKSPKEVEGYFDKLKYKVNKREMTINDMEYVELIPKQMDGRAHFVVVCADNGSLPLEKTAVTGANLEALMEQKTKEFVANPKNFKIDMAAKTVHVSQLFEWYEKDYKADPKFKGTKAVEYLVPYVSAEHATFLKGGDYTVKFIEWDWVVNDVAAK